AAPAPGPSARTADPRARRLRHHRPRADGPLAGGAEPDPPHAGPPPGPRPGAVPRPGLLPARGRRLVLRPGTTRPAPGPAGHRGGRARAATGGGRAGRGPRVVAVSGGARSPRRPPPP